MTIREYMAINGDIFITNQPPFTTQHKTAVNNMLKYNYGSKEMYYSEKVDVDAIVSMVLYENRLKYVNSSNLVTFVVPNDYTEQTTDTGTVNNTGTQLVNGTTIKDNTGTVAVIGSDSRENTGTQAIDNTGTVGVVDSTDTTIQPNDTTKSQLGFDGGALVANEKMANSINESSVDGTSTTTNDLNTLRTDNLSEAGTKSETRTDNLNEVVDDSKTRTDNLTESHNNTLKHLDVEKQLNLLERVREHSGNIRVSEVVIDLIAVLCVRDWNSTLYN